MKIVCISDTHGQHDSLHLPEGDMIIHAGDISKRGMQTEVTQFLSWNDSLDFQFKIFIGGNHDFFFENACPAELKSLIPNDLIYLNDSGIEIEGIKFWGSPIQPWFYNWAFNKQRGSDIRKHWDLIPENTNILITHGPAAGKLDVTKSNEHVGCLDLLEVIERIKPQYHICGHIHEAYGKVVETNTTYINCSVLNLQYQLRNDPIIVVI